MKTAFVYGPYLMLLITFAAFVLRCKVRVRAQAIWAIVLLACFSKFLCYRTFGGDAFNPEMPEHVIWFWNWAYSGAFILGVLAVLALPFRLLGRIVLLPLVAWSLSAWGVWNGIKPPLVRELTVAYEDLPPSLDGYRIVQLSDLHVSSAARRWRTTAIVEAANACMGDLIVITGDLVDGLPRERLRDVMPLKNLSARDGVFACTGNHEAYYDVAEWLPWYEHWGIQFLANDCVSPHAGLALAGVDDEKVGYPDVARAFGSATNGMFRVLLQHRPKGARDNASKQDVQLQLSGHTHGGIFPVMSWIVKGFNDGFVRGLYSFNRQHSALYVSSGVGQWAGFPLRFFNPTEISVITLRRFYPPLKRPQKDANFDPYHS